MMITIKSVKNRHIKRCLEHGAYLALVLMLIPSIFYFEIYVVLPTVAKEWSIEYCVHFSFAIFFLVNIIGNLIYGAFTNTSTRGRLIKVNNQNWNLCAVCECYQPPRAWHCNLCNICILKRDHHCSFLACCVGYYNQRYFFFFTMYIFIAMSYAFYFNVRFMSGLIPWNHGFVIIKFIFPLVNFFIDSGSESLYIFIIMINIILIAFAGFLFLYHLRNILRGTTVPESRKCKPFLYDRGWKLNLVEVFGEKWYLTWILPFIKSPLPGNGIEWNIDDKAK